MGKFDAEKIGAMEWDLSKYRPDPDADGLEDAERDRRRALAELAWAGTIPEPPREAVAAFFNALQDVRLATAEALDDVRRERRESAVLEWRAAHPDDEDTPEDTILDRVQADEPLAVVRERVALMASVQNAAAEKQFARIADLVDELTGGSPCSAVLRELPQRTFDMFLGWLSGEFSPESVAAAMQQ